MADGRKRGHASLVRAGHGKGCSAEGIRRQLAREADFSRRGSTFPFLRLIHFHFLFFTIFSILFMGMEAKTVVLGLYFNDPNFGLVQSFTMRSKDKSA